MANIRFDDQALSLVIDDLPALVGSEKQVAWAESIRRDLFDYQISQRFDAARRAAVAAGRMDQADAAIAKMSDLLAPVLAETSAKWWIDNRNCDLQQVAHARAAR
jgi:hypothetical protein